jgi:pyrophosphate--fructose-6-phosphate 1-phosphotransferase
MDLGILHEDESKIMGKQVKRVGILTAGGLAPCLSAAIGYLIEEYSRKAPDVDIIGYVNGYMGLLKGHSLPVTPTVRERAQILVEFGGSPIGNSRVKLANAKDCVKRGLVKEGQDPRQVAADQLIKDEVDVLHTIGGDDTNTAAADLAGFLKSNGHDLTVVGLPKTVDNDVYPIRQSLGAWTAAEQGARFFANIVAESSANPRMLIVHEVMGRNCGWLTAATAQGYESLLDHMIFLPELGLGRERREVHGLFIPEMAIDVQAEAARLRLVMDRLDAVNLLVSEGACAGTIVAEMEARGEKVPRDAFGHPKLDKINVGAWFAQQFGGMLGAEKTLVQKSGYFSRSAPANAADRELIHRCAVEAVRSALEGQSGVVGEDEVRGNVLRVIEFDRIRGGKPFDIDAQWFGSLLGHIGQAKGAKVEVAH